MEKVASKVEAIADQVSEVLFANAEKQVEKKMRSELGKVRLYRYNHQDHSMEQNPSSNYLQNEIINGNNLRECEDHHALCLHLPLEHSQFNIRSEGEGGSLCFDAGPETLVVTVGNQLEVIRLSSSFHLVDWFSFFICWINYLGLFSFGACRGLNVFQGKWSLSQTSLEAKPLFPYNSKSHCFRIREKSLTQFQLLIKFSLQSSSVYYTWFLCLYIHTLQQHRHHWKKTLFSLLLGWD